MRLLQPAVLADSPDSIIHRPSGSSELPADRPATAMFDAVSLGLPPWRLGFVSSTPTALEVETGDTLVAVTVAAEPREIVEAKELAYEEALPNPRPNQEGNEPVFRDMVVLPSESMDKGLRSDVCTKRVEDEAGEHQAVVWRTWRRMCGTIETYLMMAES